MKLRRIVLGSCLVGYLLQVATAIYLTARPVAVHTLPGVAVTATLRKDVNPFSFVPLIGFGLLVRPENYHLALSNGYEEKILGIDVREDLPLEDLKAVNEGTETLVVRQSTGREVARLASAKTGR
jgi:hypothetical protein